MLALLLELLTDMSEPITLSPEHFWKIKAITAEARLLNIQIQELMDSQREKISATFREAGLDPDKNYTMNDTNFTATPKELA